MLTTLLLETPLGSRLHGLASATSDIDTLQVFSNRENHKQASNRPTHKIDGEDDRLTVQLSTFLALCDKGVPQMLEAMFSPQAYRSPLMQAYSAAYRPNLGACYDTFTRVMKAELLRGDAGKAKSYRHALRLTEYMNQLHLNGRFNPTLSEEKATLFLTLCQDREATYAYLEANSFIRG